MKKIMIAAVAATMASVSMADISIKGDAYVTYADKNIGDKTSGISDDNKQGARVNLFVTGKTGATSVVLHLRNDGTSNKDRGAGGENGLKVKQQFITTKIGPISVKAGDFYGTVGLGAWSKGAPKNDALSLSTQAGAVKLGFFTSGVNDNSGSNVSASGKIAGAAVKVIHNPDSWTNFSVKGTFNGILVAAEKHDSKKKNTDVSVIHVGGKVDGVKWDVAQLKNGSAITKGNAKFTPLGSMLIGTAINDTAAADVGNFSKITGISASTNIAGNTVKGIFSKNTLGQTNTLTGLELIVSRKIAGGELTANLGKISGSSKKKTDLNAMNKGVGFSVKF